MVGIIDKIMEENHSHASQIGENEYVLHAGLITKVNHSCDPNCGIRVNETGAHDSVAIKGSFPNFVGEQCFRGWVTRHRR